MKKLKSFLMASCMEACLILIIIRPFYPKINSGGYLDNALFLFEIFIWILVFISTCMAISYSQMPEDKDKKENIIKSAKTTIEKSKKNIILKYINRVIYWSSVVVLGVVSADFSLMSVLVILYIVFYFARENAKKLLKENNLNKDGVSG
jgi:hypothetical protein